MTNQKVVLLEQAIDKIQEAKNLIREALLDTDSARESINILNDAIYDLRDQFGVGFPKSLIDFDIAVVTFRFISNQLIGTKQTPKATFVRA